MQLYLLRHGAAERHAASGRDADRQLTNDGHQAVRRNAQRLADKGVIPSVILSSPYTRARQTARAAAEVLGYKETILETRALTPEASPEELWSEVRADHGNADSLLLVTHEPLVSSALSFLIGSTEASSPFPTAGLARIDFEQLAAAPRGVVQWMLR